MGPYNCLLISVSKIVTFANLTCVVLLLKAQYTLRIALFIMLVCKFQYYRTTNARYKALMNIYVAHGKSRALVSCIVMGNVLSWFHTKK